MIFHCYQIAGLVHLQHIKQGLWRRSTRHSVRECGDLFLLKTCGLTPAPGLNLSRWAGIRNKFNFMHNGCLSAFHRTANNREITLFFWNFRVFWIFFKFCDFLRDFAKLQFQKFSEIRNLNFVTSELDSESLSTLRKIIFKRDSSKVDVVAAPVITSCAKNG
jgi:hypothetical protein